ncbi:MAG: hypothetical protein AB7V40_07315 [Methyloceanibacter sp.]
MDFRGLGIAAIAAFSLIAVAKPDPAQAASAALSAVRAEPSLSAATSPIAAPVLHRHRAQSFYCLERNYWWFYRPYTTATDDHPRCMPYFHYLGPGGREKSDRYIK